MFAGIEAIVHRVRRRLSRSEWAIRHLGLTPSEGTSEEPGLLLIQIDGLARRQLEAAIAAGRMPYLGSLLRRHGYALHTFYPGLPSTTPAVQAELYYGVRSAVPAFSFYDRALQKLGRMWDPEWAKAREARYREEAEGLLQGGSSWSNIYTGGASQEESHFCAASIGFGDMWRSGKFRNVFLFLLLQFPAAVRLGWLLLVELAVAFSDGVRAVAAGRRPGVELFALLSRVFVGVGVRELITISGQIDVSRGLPIVHVNFVGYDEQAHQRGPGSRFAHFGLRGIDHAIRKIARAAHRSPRRDYSVWVFSDHGQEHTRSFADVVPGGIEALIQQCWESSQAPTNPRTPRSQRRPVAVSPLLSRRGQARERQAAQLTLEEGKTFAVAAMGPVAHIYFAERQSEAALRALARRLIDTAHVPGALLAQPDGAIVWLHAHGETRVPDGVAALLPHPAPLAAEIARDLAGFVQHPDAGDLILLGWSPWDPAWSFAPERGAHGGFAPDETQGFCILPIATPLPPGTDAFIRPSALRAAALHHLGRAPFPVPAAARAETSRVRLMTYNVHGCSGMDGRVSPRRVARVIAAQNPDLVALQEIDLGRRRSRAEDQASLIARQLGMHSVFCPTVTRGNEHYGHALLSRWPIEVVKRALLPHDPRSWWKEPRAALAARVIINGTPVFVVTTHLGLGRHERVLQMRALLGSDWLGRVPDDEAIVMCGDFNLSPGSPPYLLAAARLRDAQLACPGHRPLRTFSSNRPFARLDHVFTSARFDVQGVTVPRNDLTRVTSDHLPLVVDLSLVPVPVGTPTHIRV
jgi:endonuclease/exonuclease/phosphatase family metal-dependent hydrolase